ncbi:MAG: hypothetical protein N2202_00270 [Proteobacteria bacterium]|nr:hypothetical protein [Pseudomonadota bacterium]
MLKNNFLNKSSDKRLKIFILLFLAILFFFGEYRFFLKIFNYLKIEVEFLSKHLTIQLVNIMNLTFLSMLFFSNLTNSIYYFYVSEDLELLLSYPLNNKRLIISRYLQTTITSSWMVIFAMIPFYYALFESFSFSKYNLFLIFLLYLFLFLSLSALGCLITLFIVNYFPAKRAHQILWSISAIFIAFIFIVIRLIRPERLFRPIPDQEFMKFLKGLETPEYPFLPSTWITKGFSALTFDKNANQYLIYLLMLFLFTILCFLIFIIISNKIYTYSFSRAKSDFIKKEIKGSKLDIIAKIIPFSNGIRQFFLKDLKEIARDTGQWSQLLLLVGLVFVYLFSVKSLPIKHAITMNMVAFFNIGILEFILASLINRFVFPSFSQEGKVMWIVKSFPIEMHQIFLSKFLLYFIPLLIFGILLSLFSNKLLNVDSFMYLFTVINVLTMTAVLTFFGLSFSIIYPHFKFSNVTEISFSYGGITYMLFSMLYIGLSIVIQAGPVYSYLKNKLFAQTISYLNFIISYAFLLFISVLSCLYLYNRAKKTWENWE